MVGIVPLVAISFAAPAHAAVVSERPDSVTVTIYHDETIATSELADKANESWLKDQGIAFITEARSVDIPAGDETIEFRGVASTIVPQTAEIEGLPPAIAEQNFDYDLLSPGSLLDKSIGNTVKLVRTDEKTGKRTEESAIVRSAPNGTVLEIGGRIEALKCSGLPEKIVLEKIPEGLRDVPTLSVRTHAAKAGHYTLKLSYIATGINWSADYVARIHPDGKSLDLSGFITLANFTDTSFDNVPVEVVAGTLSTTGRDHPVESPEVHKEDKCWPTDIEWGTLRPVFARLHRKLAGIVQGTPVTEDTVVVTGSRIPTIAATRLGDYKLYSLPERSSVASHQMKQVQFVEKADVIFERIYSYSVEHEGNAEEEASVAYRWKNTNEAHLGIPLPAGSISVVNMSGSNSVLAGQSGFIDIAVGNPIELETGRAVDVRVHERRLRDAVWGHGVDRQARDSIEIAAENEKTVSVLFEVRDTIWDVGKRIVDEDMPHTMEPKGVTWRFTLQPGERKAVHYVIEIPEPER